MDDGADILTDVLIYILQCVQPNARGRLRLVCRHWRQLIDTCTATSLCSRAKTRIVTVERAYVLHDLYTERWTWAMPKWSWPLGGPKNVVGTCNGIICMCDHFGDILLHNPATLEKLALPSLPPRHKTGTSVWHQTYSFTHDQRTGRYMVVHMPLSFGLVVVFTLGEASWRDVVIPGATLDSRCNLKDGFVTIDSTMYWAVKGKEPKVMSFDLDKEQAPSVIPLPSSRQSNTWRLTEVLGRLGIVVFSWPTEVFVMEQGARWNHWYSVQVLLPRPQPKWHDNQHLMSPHFASGRNHVMTWEWSSTGGGCALYQHKGSDDTSKAQHGTVEISKRNQGNMVARIKTDYDFFQRFDYVETMEPLSVYKCW